MLMCNPNAGYYEFIYFQSDWLEFYLSREVNVFLWNYRGFGKSTGSPNITNIIEDGKILMGYLKNNENAALLGIHGESLGGCIAIRLAEACGCNFIFVDRSFGYLSDTIFFHLGLFAYCCFKISGITDYESVTSFLKLDCYKLIATDPLDELIKYPASLSSSIATRLILNISQSISKLYLSNKWNNIKWIASNTEIQEFFKSWKLLEKQWEIICSQDKDINKPRYILNTEENEDNSENAAKFIVETVMDIFNNINAGGMSLRNLMNTKHFKMQFRIWAMVIEIWGSDRGEYKNFNDKAKIKAIEDLQTAISKIKSRENVLVYKDIEIITKILEKILDYLQEKLNNHTISLVRSQSLIIESDTHKNGFLMILECGHSGQFNQIERRIYEKHLAKAKFIEY